MKNHPEMGHSSKEKMIFLWDSKFQKAFKSRANYHPKLPILEFARLCPALPGCARSAAVIRVRSNHSSHAHVSRMTLVGRANSLKLLLLLLLLLLLTSGRLGAVDREFVYIDGPRSWEVEVGS